MTLVMILEHMLIVLSASLLSIAVGLPLGIWAYVSPKMRAGILRIVDLLQTVPSLALLGMIMVVLTPGKLTVIIGITLYSLLPIVRNTCLGLLEVESGIKEAARGMGMSKPYRTLMIEFPLAFPTAFTGIRIAVVNAIGTAAFVGGGGLGGIITQGIRVSDLRLVLAATAILMAIAVVLDNRKEVYYEQKRVGNLDRPEGQLHEKRCRYDSKCLLRCAHRKANGRRAGSIGWNRDVFRT